MFTKKVNPPDKPARRRGRPSGTTIQGQEARKKLYETAIELIGRNGYEATTLRDVAESAGVSAGLLYKYFPSKRAVVLAFYDELSSEYAARATGMLEMKDGKWRMRFVFAVRTCFEVLGPHRATLVSLAPILVADREHGLFAARTAFSRQRVEQVFRDAVTGASDQPSGNLAEPMGRLLYLLHLAVILWWLLDKSPKQRATHALVSLLEQILASFGFALLLPQVRGFVRSADVLVREALFDDVA
jgi:AcrR family transcriptional regulator